MSASKRYGTDPLTITPYSRLIKIYQEANWYKPESGEPYRPLIAMPSKIKQLGGWLRYCDAGFFTAYDPPHALVTEAALLPPTAAGDPKPAPAPSPTQDPPAGATVAGKGSTLQPAIVPTVDQPKATKSPVPISNDGTTSSDTQSIDPAAQDTSPSESTPSSGQYNQGGDPDHSSISRQGSGSKVDSDPKKGGNPKQSSDSKQAGGSRQDSDPNYSSDPNHMNPEPGTDPSKSYLLITMLTAITSYGNSDINADTIAPSDPNQSDTAGLVGDESGQDVPPVNILKAPTSPDTSNDPTFASKVSPQPVVSPDLFNAFLQDQPTTINSQVIQKLSQGISIAGTALTLGAPPITVSGTPIAYGPSVLAVGTITISFAFSDPKPITTSIAGQTVTIGQDAVAIAGTTLTPGATAITVSGTSISLGSSALVIGTSTIPLPSRSPKPLITTVANHAVTAAPNGAEVVDTTLHPGVPGVTLDGTVVLLASSGQLIVGSKTMTLPSESAGLGGLIVGGLEHKSASDVSDLVTTTIASQVVTAASSVVALASTTLTLGAPGKIIAGTLVSLNTAGQLVVGSKTVTLMTENLKLGGLVSEESSSGISDPIITTVAGQATTVSSNAIAFAGTTLTPGAPGKTINGTLVSLNTAGQLVVGSITVALQSESKGVGRESASVSNSGSLITTIPTAPNVIAFAGTILTPGAPGQTINGTLISLNTAGQLVAGSKTIPLANTSAGLGGLIMGGSGNGKPFGAASTSAVGEKSSSGNGNGNGARTSVKVFRGGAGGLKGGLGWMMGGGLVVAFGGVGGM